MEPPTLEELVKKFRLPLILLDQECSSEHLKSISSFLDWRVVSRYMGLTDIDIQDIESDKRTEPEKRLQTLEKWKEKYAYKATYKKLVESLLDKGDALCAQKVCQLLQTQVHEGPGAATASAIPSDQPQGISLATTESTKQLPSSATIPNDKPHDNPVTTAELAKHPAHLLHVPSKRKELQETGKRESGEYTLDTPECKSDPSFVADGSTSPQSKQQGDLSLKDVNTVRKEIYIARKKWKDIALELGMLIDDTDSIKSRCNEDKDCLLEVLRWWLTRATPKATWDGLAEALKSCVVEEYDLADDIQKMYCHQGTTLKASVSVLQQQVVYTGTSDVSDTALDCQTSDGNSKIILPYLNTRGLNEQQKGGLEGRLLSDSMIMMRKFQTLVSDTNDSLRERNVTADDLRMNLKTLHAWKPVLQNTPAITLTDYLREAKQSNSSVNQICDGIMDYVSFLNFGIIEHIIERMGTDRDKINLRNYKEELDVYCKRRVYECPPNVGPSGILGNKRIVAKKDGAFMNYTVQEVLLFQNKLATILHIEEHTLQLESVHDGCMQVTFEIPELVANKTFPLSKKQEESLKQERVIQLTCGEYEFLMKEEDFIQYSTDMDKTEDKPTVVKTQLSTSDPLVLYHINPAQEARLLSALESADLDTAIQLIPTDIPSLVRLGPNRLTPLHYACQHGRLDVMRLLVIKYPCDVKLLGEGTCSPLHIASKYGQLESAKFLVENKLFSKAVVNACGTNTPLHIAAEEGHITMITLLIEKNICNVSIVNGNGDTPLHVAAACNQLSIIKYFIRHTQCDSAVINSKNSQTPLHLAAEKGHLNVVKYLIAEGHSDPSCPNRDGMTPLHLAAGGGQTQVVQFLIAEKLCNSMCGTTVRKNNIAPGRTPLHIASFNGQLSVVQYLVTEQHCKPSCIDDDGITPLHLASQEGHLDIVMFLAENYSITTNPSVADSNGNTPLHNAAEQGYLSIVDYFVKNGHFDPASKNRLNGQTPLHLAAEQGHLDAVKYFIEKQQCNSSCTDKRGKTPLYLAAGSGKLQVVKYLIAEKKCDPMCRTKTGKTALHICSRNGHLEVVKYLTEDNKCNPMIPESDSQYQWYPLHFAAFKGHIKVVKFFVEEEQCDPMCRTKNGETPLHLCSQNGHLEVVKYLTEGVKCDSMCHNKDNVYPLHSAAFKGHTEVVKYLVEEKQCDLMCSTKGGRTPLHFCSENGHLEVVKYITKGDKCDSMCQDEDNICPLHLAAFNGHIEIVRFLVEEKKCYPMCQCKDGTTPLHWACEAGQLDIIEYLASQVHFKLFSESINEQLMKDIKGRSPFHYVVASDQFTVLQYLIAKLNFDPLCKDQMGNTVLHYAAHHGFLSVVEYLVTIHPNIMITNNSGYTPLHLAALKGHLKIVQLLTNYAASTNSQYPASVMTPGEETVLHAASRGGHIDVVMFLIGECQSDPMCRDANGNTPLHIAASMGYKEIIMYLAQQKHFDVNCITTSGDTALHDACAKGYIDIVKILVDDQNCDPSHANNTGATPLHLAVANGHIDIVQFLCNKKKYSQFCSTSYWTPLHLACNIKLETLAMTMVQILSNYAYGDLSSDFKGMSPLHLTSYNGHTNIVKFLINDAKYDPLQPDETDRIALHYAVESQEVDVIDYLLCCKPDSVFHSDQRGVTPIMCATSEDIVAKLLLKGADPRDIKIKLPEKLSYLTSENYDCLTTERNNVYVVGNARSGKSTLIEGLKSEHKWFFKRLTKVTVSTSVIGGIIPSVYDKSKHFGPVVFHEFSGEKENYCGHASILKSCDSSAKPIFVIVISLTDPLDDIKKQISYWLHWVSNLCTVAECHSIVMIAGSHRDRLKLQELREKDLYLQKILVSDEISHTTVHVLGATTLNCQQPQSTGMSKLREMLKKACKVLQNLTTIHSMLLAFTKLTFSTPVQLEIIQAYIAENKIPLPQLLEELCKFYQDLDGSGHIMLLKNENDPEKSWVVLDQECILHLVDNFLRDAREHPQYRASGVVPFSELAAWFGDHFHPGFIREYLIHIEVCQETTGFLHLEWYNFFPTLLDAMPHQDLWNFNPKYEQYFGWCLQTMPHKFFPVKFLHALFLQLASSFASSPGHVEKVVSEDCYIWKNGIHWFHMVSGTEVVVQFCEQNTTVTVMARCKKGHEMKYYRHRSAVLKTFIDVSEEFHLKSITKEYILHPDGVSKYQYSQPKPMSNLKLFSVSEIAKALIRQLSLLVEDKAEQSVLKRDSELPDTEIQDLLHFEPFLGIQRKTLETLFSKATEEVTAPFLWSLVNDMHRRWKNLEIIAEIFGCHIPRTLPVISEVESATIMGKVLSSKGDIGGLCHKLQEYSIFCGRNVLEIADGLHQLSDTTDSQTTDITDDEAEGNTKVKDYAEEHTPSLLSQGHHRPASPIWRVADGTLLDTNELSHIRSELIYVTEWFPLGLALGLHFSTLEKIKLQHEGQVDECMRDVLIAWLKREDNVVEQPSWRALAKALSQPMVNKVALAHQIATTYTSHNSKTLTLPDYYNPND